jgi:multisubunit Na+/H+ antiporter MnhE subunit
MPRQEPPSAAPDRSRRRRILAWGAQFALSLGLYFCFAAKLDLGEAAIGVVVAALAATGSHAVLRRQPVRPSIHARWIAQAWRLPKYAVTGTWEIFSVLARHLFTRKKAESLLLEVPFTWDEDEGDAALRRALAAAYTTITPNFIVIGFDEGRRRMIFHQIDRSEIPEMTRRLGAEA